MTGCLLHCVTSPLVQYCICSEVGLIGWLMAQEKSSSARPTQKLSYLLRPVMCRLTACLPELKLRLDLIVVKPIGWFRCVCLVCECCVSLLVVVGNTYTRATQAPSTVNVRCSPVSTMSCTHTNPRRRFHAAWPVVERQNRTQDRCLGPIEQRSILLCVCCCVTLCFSPLHTHTERGYEHLGMCVAMNNQQDTEKQRGRTDTCSSTLCRPTWLPTSDATVGSNVGIGGVWQ